MFDEPTAGMSLDEVPVILDLIDEIKLEGDKTVLLVEHRMDVIKRLADRIVVLQDGAMIADGPPAEVVALPAVQQAYLGMQTGAKPRHRAGHG
jgi:branched-chain amino acid transport system ATP-binding protein